MSEFKSGRGMSRSRGLAMTEYLIITMAMIVAVSVPYGADSKSAVERLVEAMRQEHSAYLYAVSLTPLPDVCCD